MSYLYVPEGRTCRYDKITSPSDVNGLITAKFTLCNIIIIIDKNRISMTHANQDKTIDKEHIKKELTWVTNGKPKSSSCRKVVIRRKYDVSDTQESAKELVSLMTVSEYVFQKTIPEYGFQDLPLPGKQDEQEYKYSIVAVDKTILEKDISRVDILSECVFERNKSELIQNIEYHPFDWKLDCIYQINFWEHNKLGHSINSTHSIVIYNGEKWITNLENNNLSKKMRKILMALKNADYVSLIYITNIIQDFNPNLKSKDFENLFFDLLPLSLRVQQYFYEGSTEKCLFNNVKDLLKRINKENFDELNKQLYLKLSTITKVEKNLEKISEEIEEALTGYMHNLKKGEKESIFFVNVNSMLEHYDDLQPISSSLSNSSKKTDTKQDDESLSEEEEDEEKKSAESRGFGI